MISCPLLVGFCEREDVQSGVKDCMEKNLEEDAGEFLSSFYSSDCCSWIPLMKIEDVPTVIAPTKTPHCSAINTSPWIGVIYGPLKNLTLLHNALSETNKGCRLESSFWYDSSGDRFNRSLELISWRMAKHENSYGPVTNARKYVLNCILVSDCAIPSFDFNLNCGQV
ncbi:hypothetical protein Tco_1069782 [Tanacetum coccineum]|uniref:Uncharacterized protein n=1 Tax=Tanacetum coccineum TaxID=301880 RepID=A0ABQ5HLF6_9ASTR